MISRRHIRVLVMQTLYSLNYSDSAFENINTTITKTQNIFEDKVEQIALNYYIAIHYLIRIVHYDQIVAGRAQKKYLKPTSRPTSTVSLADNSFIQKIEQSEVYQKISTKNRLENFNNQDLIKSAYQLLTATEEYNAYKVLPTTDSSSDRKIIETLWNKVVLENENIQALFSDEILGWELNIEPVYRLMSNLFKKNNDDALTNYVVQEYVEYGKELLQAVIEKDSYCDKWIAPKLKNWDEDRIAVIDMILLKLGVCEFLYFETIPTIATINEYIEIAKSYSTPNSGQFVNGVLDNILKDLTANQLINKTNLKSNG
ncbi:MAG: transcription antitermination factor NusB [Chitinophagia bacterium]|nr:transcription antitermination factor NusB [Chitinophagia bacterium]